MDKLKKVLLMVFVFYAAIVVLNHIALQASDASWQNTGGWQRVAIIGVLFALLFHLAKVPLVRPLLEGLWSAVSEVLLFLLKPVTAFLSFVFSGIEGITHPSRAAKFMSPLEQFALLNRFHKGVVLNGKHKRLSEKVSFQSLVAVGGMGKGKSSTQVIPNLLTLDNCSMVVTDTSGELFTQTSGYLAEQGFDVQVLDLINLDRSFRYNPLSNPKDFTEIQKLAHLIIDSADVSNGDSFWGEGAKKILRILIQCLKNQQQIAANRTGTSVHQNASDEVDGEENTTNKDYVNLANLRHLLNSFDAHSARPGTSKIDKFVTENTLNDPETFSDYKGFTTATNPKTMLSFLSTADTALAALGNPDICRLTAQHDFDFKKFRQRKTVIYVLVKQQDLSFYKFLLNAFYTDLIQHLMADLNDQNLPVYLLLDEFGHLKIPDFPVVATTARKYKVSLYLFLQSLSQLQAQYGFDGAQTILDGLGTEVYFSGLSLETAQNLAQRLGQNRQENMGNVPLMTETEIIRMKDEEVLVLHSNKPPIKLKVKPFFEQRALRRKAKIAPVNFPKKEASPVDYLRL